MTTDRRNPTPDDQPTVLKGVGPRTEAALRVAGIHRVIDLLLHVPFRYEDRSREVAVDDPGRPGDRVLVRGRLERVTRTRVPRPRLDIVRAVVCSEAGATLPVVWFNQGWMEERARTAHEVRLWGTLRKRRGGCLELINPEMTPAEGDDVVAVYRRLGPLAGRRLRRVIDSALGCLPTVVDPLSADDRASCSVLGIVEALTALHRPSVGHLEHDLERARRRLAFDELLRLTGRAVARRQLTASLTAPRVTPGAATWSRLIRALPFDLTVAQQRVLAEISDDLSRGRPMGRLVQGDVGCGKTVVAALAMMAVADAGYQAALMAPTEMLAIQHARSLRSILEPLGVSTATLVGSLPPTDSRAVRERIASGSVAVVIGTHTLFQAAVHFSRLGLVVIDEQHRFGVVQRQALVNKGRGPHVLVMTATPIPRSLAMTVHGDLDLSVIDELPPGRQPVRTVLRSVDARPKLIEFLRREIDNGGRVFWVFPVIEESDDGQLPALLEHEVELRSQLGRARVGLIHGRLEASEREATTDAFRRGDLDVLLATTVVEVGVDVPHATVMVIEGAERFGLSQLHQLRGRVGRGPRRSWCVALASSGLSTASRRRLELFCELDDGFRLAEADLELRGPGEIDGVRQWGRSGFRFADLARDGDLVARARTVADRFHRQGRLVEISDRLDALYGHPTAPSSG